MTPAITVRDLSKSFGKGPQVLNGINLTIQPGEFVGLIGPSGSGKSTLIRMISGLERVASGEGSVDIKGETVQKNGRKFAAQRRLRREVGVIFQQFNLVGRISLLKNVLAGRLGRVPGWRETLGFFGRKDRIIALTSLERVDMVEFARQRASQLSGGQQQRGAIARALTQHSSIILADEPIASLDPASAESVMELLAEINRTDGTTIIVSLHQIEHAFRHCSRIVALKDGDVISDGATDEIKTEDLSALYGIDLTDGNLDQSSEKIRTEDNTAKRVADGSAH